MSESDLFGDKLFREWKSVNGAVYVQRLSSRQSLKAKFDEESSLRGSFREECTSHFSRSGSNWCDALSSSLSNVNARQAWKSSTEKFSQTLNNVRTTFGSLSQKIKKSAKKGQPLINMDSPKTPMTPYAKSRAVLGRTPTKLYSPFGIDTPMGKENVSDRATIQKTCYLRNSIKKGGKKKQKVKSDVCTKKSNSHGAEVKLSNDVLQTQIGIYEFQSVANKILQNDPKK